MSDSKIETKEEFREKIEKAAALENLKQDTYFKKLVVENQRFTDLYNRNEQNKKELALIEKADVSTTSLTDSDTLIKQATDYFAAAKIKTSFLTKDFDEILHLRPRQLITFAASSGTGKSTLAANIAKNIMSQKNPDGKNKSVLVIANEEIALDVYCRVCCLFNGWSYANHSELTEYQIKKFQEFIAYSKKTGLLQVIDDSFGDVRGNTTTIEGIKSIFQKIIDQKIQYDAIVIDYFQNIATSKVSTDRNEYQIQYQTLKLFDQFKNDLKCPIILLAQVHKPDGKNTSKTYVDSRFIGSKHLKTVSTEFIELFTDFDKHETEWFVHKSRFLKAQNKSIVTSFKNGEYVSLSQKQLEERKFLEEQYLAQKKLNDKIKDEKSKQKWEV